MKNVLLLNLACVLIAVGCDADSESSAKPEFLRLENGGLVQLSVADEADEAGAAEAISLRGGQSTPAPKPTKPWEPGSGYFVVDRNHPETRSWYNDCYTEEEVEAAQNAPDPFGLVVEIVADGASKTRSFFHVVTKVPESPVFIDTDGEPITVGKRLAVPGETTFKFQGLYVDCTDSEPNVTDLRQWGIDAVLSDTSQCQEFWDLGQNRFRQWYWSEHSCTGEDCDDPWVQEISAPDGCVQTGLNVYKRIPSPFED